jgi:uncharacterized membrane protein (UPF0182 family)
MPDIKGKKLRKGIIIAGVAIILLGGALISLTGFITDLLWFNQLGYIDVFFKKLFTELKIGVPVFVIFFALSLLFIFILRRRFFAKISGSENIEVNVKLQKRIAILFAVLASGVITLFAVSGLWWKVLQFLNSTDFNLEDPIFKNDVSFYLFKLDFVSQLPTVALIIVVTFLALAFLYYSVLQSTTKGYVAGDEEETVNVPPREKSAAAKTVEGILESLLGRKVEFPSGGGGGVRVKRKTNFGELIALMRVEIIVLVVCLCLVVAAKFFLMQFELLNSQTGVVYGAGYTDTHIKLWVYRAMAALSVIAAVTVSLGIARAKIKMAIIVPIIMAALFLVGNGAGFIVQQLVVAPDAIEKESKYLANNIKFTQHAYDLDKVSVKSFAANSNLTPEDIKNNEATIKNIRINDYQQAQKFYNQVQNIRRYYRFNDVDVDRYTIDGEYTQTFLSVREIDESQVDDQWINKHMKYTHGYGATISRVDKVTPNGQPDILLGNIPPETEKSEIAISQPGIYFGELSNNYVLTGTGEDEFDYPDGNENVYSKYEGTDGIKLNFFNRLLFAIRERSLKLLVSSNITNDSKILINRNIAERVQKVMPMLDYSDPYAVVLEGRLSWIIDGYTTSASYPYSEPYAENGVNYIRNSVKVVIDAYNGDTTYYLVDDKDPIANTMKKIYPTLFKSGSEMPANVREHIRYPHTMLQIQSEVYTRYHVNDVKVFYQQEDSWQVSNETLGTEEVEMTPSYFVLKLPGEKKEEFVNMLPYTPKDKKNMTGLLVARNDGDNYGELVLYQLPKSRTIMGPVQIEAQIDQDTTISKEFSLWKNAGSTYSRGNMFVLPIEDALVYVEPVYLEAKNSSLPEVKRVIVYYKDRISYKPTLAEALDDMFGENSGTFATGEAEGAGGGSGGSSGGGSSGSGDKTAPTQQELIQAASDAYDNAMDAQKAGDWAKYGTEIAKVEEYLSQLGAEQADEDDESESVDTIE